MALVTKERPRLSGGLQRHVKTYFVKDDAGGNVSQDQAVTAALAAAPTSFGSWSVVDYSYDEIATDRFDVEVIYGPSSTSNTPPEPDEGEIQYSFETSLETVTIRQSLGRIASHFDSSLQPGINQAAVDALFPGAVNVDSEDRVEGTTIQVPVPRFRYRYRAPNATVTTAYQLGIEDLAGYVNGATFAGRAAGSVRFDGARGGVKTDSAWDIEFSFTRRPNVSNLTIGGITGISADGWDFIWPYFVPIRDDDGNITPNPAYVFVDRIYPRGDFSALGLPGL